MAPTPGSHAASLLPLNQTWTVSGLWGQLSVPRKVTEEAMIKDTTDAIGNPDRGKLCTVNNPLFFFFQRIPKRQKSEIVIKFFNNHNFLLMACVCLPLEGDFAAATFVSFSALIFVGYLLLYCSKCQNPDSQRQGCCHEGCSPVSYGTMNHIGLLVCAVSTDNSYHCISLEHWKYQCCWHPCELAVRSQGTLAHREQSVA